MASRIVLFGLVDSISTKRKSGETDDGYGGQTITYTSVLTDVKCRITMLQAGEDDLMPHGYDGEELWKVIMKPNSDVLRNDLVTVTDPKFGGPAGTYRIVKLRQARDDRGGHHHTSFAMEFEE